MVSDASCEESNFLAMQFLQMTSSLNPEPHSSLKPWDVHYYIGGPGLAETSASCLSDSSIQHLWYEFGSASQGAVA